MTASVNNQQTLDGHQCDTPSTATAEHRVLAPHVPPEAQITRNCAIFSSKLAQFGKLRQNFAT